MKTLTALFLTQIVVACALAFPGAGAARIVESPPGTPHHAHARPPLPGDVAAAPKQFRAAHDR